jgi:secondary thiamine-phosphate synthase enzyme
MIRQPGLTWESSCEVHALVERLVPEGQDWYQHRLEGPDDMTSHIRAMLTDVSLTVPIDEGGLSLGTWQGLYLFEHIVHVFRIAPAHIGVRYIYAAWS